VGEVLKSRLFGALVAISLASGLSCSHQRVPQRGRSLTGTCEGTCDYYQSCKGERDATTFQACVRDCRVIFSEDGEVDRSALRELESLECREIVSYIEGEDGHSPGQGSSTAGGTSQLP
jgi:hypothetical protein